MMRRAALVCLAAAMTAACRAGEVPRGGPAGPTPGDLPSVEPLVRVGVVVADSAAVVSAASALELRAAERPLARSEPGIAWRVTRSTVGLSATSSDGRRVSAEGVPIRVVASDGTVRIGEREYRGDVLLTAPAAGGVTAVNLVELETYLRGVVPREIGARPDTEIEAVKAQAIAARTYAVSNLGSRAALGFDFYASVLDQVYGGMADEDPVADRAIAETRGMVITHDGRPILAYYSSTCGGRTAAIEDSWPWRAPLPYLKSVSDQIPGTNEYYCSTSNRFRWTTRWTRDELVRVLGETLKAHTANAALVVGSVGGVALVGRNGSNRATVDVTADGRTHRLRADSLRWVLRPQVGPALLNSSRLDDVRSEMDGAELASLEISGGGWGHGIGMCQVGAMGRARAGQSFDEILRAYYRGVEIRRLY